MDEDWTNKLQITRHRNKITITNATNKPIIWSPEMAIMITEET